MKAKQSCRTCKQRKIRCDKSIPFCNNCKNTRRECLGYRTRLLWPDHHDGRRKDSGSMVYEPLETPLGPLQLMANIS
ncbi:hypothetical protein B0J15DRAFT_81133 [Fusarium solani]|uniref:Zn(2)-C6 fungal-type domain-containing protein n=1 Tax=Fusarium solani TaxID=169388 RepID=A0A9P9GZG5_FUSSL|nr:uncharacterized protein B0J15DRAFT_81133 [Fusarium solani]KAH7247132.1 hypothetical protein B0J15DRAFT_81133 [Fusarium solani]